MDAADTTLFPADGAAAGAAGAADAAGADAGASPAGEQVADGAAAAAGADGKADSAAAGDAAKPAAGEAKPGAAAYTDFTAPEGYELDQGLLGEFTPKFKEWGLSQDQAQDLLNMAPKLVDATVQKTTQAVLAQVGLSDRGQWAEQIRTDKEIGGDKVAENVAIARRGAEALMDADTRQFLAKTGLGNHPGLVRAMYRYGKTLSEDGGTPGTSKASSQSTAQRHYANSNMNP